MLLQLGCALPAALHAWLQKVDSLITSLCNIVPSLASSRSPPWRAKRLLDGAAGAAPPLPRPLLLAVVFRRWRSVAPAVSSRLTGVKAKLFPPAVIMGADDAER